MRQLIRLCVMAMWLATFFWQLHFFASAEGPTWPSRVNLETGRRIYQLTDRPGHNMAFYYLFKNGVQVNGKAYLAYRNLAVEGPDAGRYSYFSINLETGEEVELTQRGYVGGIAEVVGNHLYCLVKAKTDQPFFSRICRYHMATGEEEVLLELEPGPVKSHNVMVNADGTRAFYYLAGKTRGSTIVLANLAEGTSKVLLEDNPGISHIQFGPVDPDVFMYNSREFTDGWKMVGFGRVDLDPVKMDLLQTKDSFLRENLKKYKGDLLSSHPYWDREGNPVVDYVDTTRPYSPEYNICFDIDRDRPGFLKGHKKVLLDMGDFQCHFNPGPTAEWFVGDGESADWWHKPGYGLPFVHAIHYDYQQEKMTLIPLARNYGAYWKSGEFEANARYVPGADMVVWNAFRTLEGDHPGMAPGAEERNERDWLLKRENPIRQNVFATAFTPTPGWDFSFGPDGWKPVKDMVDFSHGNLTREYPYIRGFVVGEDPLLLSPEGLDIPTEKYPRVLIRLRNFTTGTRLKLFFTTDTAPAFSEDNRVSMEIAPEMDRFQTYDLDMASNPNWRGSVRQLRLCPAVHSKGGKVDIGFIRFMNQD